MLELLIMNIAIKVQDQFKVEQWSNDDEVMNCKYNTISSVFKDGSLWRVQYYL